jgi:hypothetical protein
MQVVIATNKNIEATIYHHMARVLIRMSEETDMSKYEELRLTHRALARVLGRLLGAK